MASSEAAEAAVSAWATAPVDVVVCIFVSLRGDVASLSACACVCSAWAAAARRAEPWRCLDFTAVRARASVNGGARVKALVVRSGHALRELTLDGASGVADDLLAALSPGRAPALQRLSLAGCRCITADAVTANLAGAQLLTLRVAGIAPVAHATTGALQDAAIAALASLTWHGSGCDADAVCAHPISRVGGLVAPCRRLFSSGDCVTCDVCEEAFCKMAGYAQAAKHLKSCHNCSRRFCADCFDDAADDDALPFLRGHVCKVCAKALCGECARQLFARSPAVVQHFRCGSCAADVCARCAFRRDHLYCQGFVCSSGDSGGDCSNGGASLIAKSRAYKKILLRDGEDGCCAYMCFTCSGSSYGCCGPPRGLLGCAQPSMLDDSECSRQFCYVCREDKQYLRGAGRDGTWPMFRCTRCARKRWWHRK